MAQAEFLHLRTKGVWEVDGYDSPSMKLKPVKAQDWPGAAGGGGGRVCESSKCLQPAVRQSVGLFASGEGPKDA